MANTDLRLSTDRYESGFILLQHGLTSTLGELVQTKPVLSVLGDILPIVGTDRTEIRYGFLAFHGTGGADQHRKSFPQYVVSGCSTTWP
ncbi:hypothetical protein ARTHRO9V_150103 [Arthrobacter sp. 9V]|nr:hypothetical protein ARTHRO9V_150103 [Arthrobacter sp. 9V]